MAVERGRLNRRLAVRRATLGDDGHGGQVKSWSTVATIWAEAISQNGREAVLAGALQGVSAWKITIDWRGDITTDDQLRLDPGTAQQRDLNIRTIEDPFGRRDRLVIMADSASVER